MSSVVEPDLSPVTSPGPTPHGEVPRTLAEPAPRALGLLDQLGLWGNLGVSLLGFGGAVVLLHPNGPGSAPMSLLAALTATVVGTVLGAGRSPWPRRPAPVPAPPGWSCSVASSAPASPTCPRS